MVSSMGIPRSVVSGQTGVSCSRVSPGLIWNSPKTWTRRPRLRPMNAPKRSKKRPLLWILLPLVGGIGYGHGSRRSAATDSTVSRRGAETTLPVAQRPALPVPNRPPHRRASALSSSISGPGTSHGPPTVVDSAPVAPVETPRNPSLPPLPLFLHRSSRPGGGAHRRSGVRGEPTVTVVADPHSTQGPHAVVRRFIGSRPARRSRRCHADDPGRRLSETRVDVCSRTQDGKRWIAERHLKLKR